MSAWLAAAEWDAHVWWSTHQQFAAAAEAVNDARAEGMADQVWANYHQVLNRAEAEYPPDRDAARSIFILAKTWDESGGPDELGAEYSRAREYVADKVAQAQSGLAEAVGTALPLAWGLVVVGILVGGWLLLRQVES